ncbi:ABC transporter permease subunit [Kangiella sediminilitoris]|uniref:Binding-protein-dependent transport systems inner membrane component n=1 Tax=Kangiella sediminilitoris TaxID=1144748 RepID=A0A1B3B8S9_9GAMM|nr:ABC transporter permease subunit [Kangiella sediminilitoris]AOE49207.1 Binding-protein-dependent transport systems inner membrane component [Kangiella sediminilitoris]
MNTSIKDTTRKLLDQQTQSGKHKRRKLNDMLARYGIAVGGMSVIVAVVLICFYLLWVVLPIFKPAAVEMEKDFPWSQKQLLHLEVEEYGEIAFGLEPSGHMQFTDIEANKALANYKVSEEHTVSAFAQLDLKGMMAVALDNGSIQLLQQDYAISYPDNKRKLTPSIQHPFGEESIEFSDKPVRLLNGKLWDDGMILVGTNEDNELLTKHFYVEQSFLGEGLELDENTSSIIQLGFEPKFVLATPGPDWIYAIGEHGEMSSYQYEGGEWQLRETKQLTESGINVSNASFLLGNVSLMIGDSNGTISQWFQVKNENNVSSLTKIRDFKLGNQPIVTIKPEARRKGFIATDTEGKVGVFYTTSERLLEQFEFGQPIQALSINSRSNKLLVIGEDAQATTFMVENEHPEISWSAIWNQVFYEGYTEPTFTWQSSSSSNDYESKFSLVPLSFGTLKAAFYAMLFAVPLAIFGAIFTAYFMAPKMRSMVKPTVEIMEALPTVILGFLAGLWLAPLIEETLVGFLLTIILLPIFTVLFGFLWSRSPEVIRHKIPDGWQAALLLPVVIVGTMFAFWLGEPVEQWLFDGNMPGWLDDHGLNYDQRNSLVVGLAMGFAVIPTIFSITEDAIFSVPKHLTNGSLALGASQWQTLTRVVLPTASPGIFSALMIGLGRAVGETMIVLMATGNTPIMDMNIFEGMRTLSANIAVEMPESEVGSSHYRVLFLAAFVLFLFTFAFNTIAEVVRQRLRNKYGSL